MDLASVKKMKKESPKETNHLKNNKTSSHNKRYKKGDFEKGRGNENRKV